MAFVHCTFTNGSESQVYKFLVRSNSAAKKWKECLKNAVAKSVIRDRGNWYNFSYGKYSNTVELAKALNQIIDELNRRYPLLITEKVDFESIQDSVNRLHVHFADSHLVKDRITEESDFLWYEFNNLLHAFEAVQRSEELGQDHPNASIVLTWQNNFRIPLEDQDFENFTVAKKFGTIYVNYCQIGRHLFELFQAQDSWAADEHILPLKYCSADSYFWFGPSTGKKGLENKIRLIEDWYKAHPKLSLLLKMEWGNPKLAIGWIPVADLVTSEGLQPKQVLDSLLKFNSVDKIEITEA